MVHSIQQFFGKLFGIQEVNAVQWRLGNGLSPTLLALLLVGSLVFVFWSYFREGEVKKRGLLIALRLSAIIVLLLLLLQPSVTFQHEKEGVSRVYAVIDKSQSMTIKDDGEQTRWELATDILTDEERGLLKQLEDRHEVELIAVGEQVTTQDEKNILSESPDAEASALGSALHSIKEKDATAVVVVSDLAWNAGDDPVTVASRLGDRGVAVFPVPVGHPNSPDAAILSVHIRDRVFPGEELPLKVQIRATAKLEGLNADMVVRFDDREVARQRVTHVDGQQMVEIPLKGLDLKGSVQLKVELEALEGEVSSVNNVYERSITFLDDKVKVLYVEGAPRWEYRYLRTVLMRDERLEVKFLMTQGDTELASYSPEYISSFPAVGESNLDFDLVILGDVPASYFETAQMEWMVQQVKRQGASLLMLGGAVHAPQSYVGSPIENLLPVKIEGDEWEQVADEVIPSPTDEGLSGRIATLGVDEQQARRLWAQIAPLYEAPPVSAKPGANVLVTMGRKRVQDRPYPLVAWHRYGSGKSMFVGTELLWRLRKTAGRQYHEKFWASSIQFMALSRLLGGNDRVTIEADRNRYAAGESVRLHADVLDDYLEPVTADQYKVMVKKSDSDQEPQELTLRASPGTAGFFKGFYLPPSPGDYEVVAIGADEKEANTLRFSVYSESIELRNPAMRIDTAEQMAQYSGGEVIMPDSIATLLEKIEEQRPRYLREMSLRLWDHPLLYVLLLVVAGGEWWLRRRQRLV